MSDILVSFSTPFWSGAATAIAIISAIFAVTKFVRSRKERVFYEIRDETLVERNRVLGATLAVEVCGKKGTSLERRSFFIFNSTGKAIDSSDFVGNSFSFSVSTGTIFCVQPIPSGMQSKFNLNYTEKEITVTDIAIPSKGCVAFELFHDGCQSGPMISNPRTSNLVQRFFISKFQINIRAFLFMFLLPAPFFLPVMAIMRFGPEPPFPYFDYIILIFITTIFLFTTFLFRKKIISILQSEFVWNRAESEYIKYMEKPASISDHAIGISDLTR